MALNKYKQFLESKTSSNGNYDNTDFLPYFNPNKLLSKCKQGQAIVRVLPRKNSDMFFMQFKKHSFKVGTAYKNNFCPYSLDASGERIGTSCPFCDFVKDNKDVIDKNTFSKLSSKDAHVMAVYNYLDDEVQKYEVNYYGITDILTAMQKLDDEFDPDADGFDLIFERDANGYAKATSANESEITLDQIAKDSKTYKGVTPELEKEIIPKNMSKYMKKLQSSFDYAVKAFAPSFAGSSITKAEEEEEEIVSKAEIKNRHNNYDPNNEESTSKKTVVDINNDVDDDDEDDDVSDIKKFLRDRKNAAER